MTAGTNAWFGTITPGVFRRRLNRFAVVCAVNGRAVRAHLPNSGKLLELLIPGRKLYLVKAAPATATARKTRYTAVAVDKGGRPVFLHTHLTNRVAAHLLAGGAIPELASYRVVRPEVPVGNSRFDFLLEGRAGQMLLEVKSCTLFGKRIAMFPDAVTARGQRHLKELSRLARRGLRSGVLFVVHSDRVRFFLPDYHTDPDFARTLHALRNRLFIHAAGVGWRDDMTLKRRVHSLQIPWELYEHESPDRGCYLLLLRLPRSRRLRVGKLGEILFLPGYYLYVGSGMRHLSRRLDRHRRRRKRLFWHIDYLREAAEFVAAFPVRTAARLECDMAAAVREMADWSVPGFGASDCTCDSHLFGLGQHPLRASRFPALLQHFRIDRLDPEPGGYDP